jgi:two-component system, chemotaxis family, CheB/CheR fusion protein
VIPPAKQLTMANGSFRATETERVRKRRMPIDLFFRSLADGYGRDSLAIILSGACSDSTLGLKRTKECGGASSLRKNLKTRNTKIFREAPLGPSWLTLFCQPSRYLR